MAVGSVGGLIGQLMGGHSARQEYGRNQPSPGEDVVAAKARVTAIDTVELSPDVPRPLPASVLANATEAADALDRGEALPNRALLNLREDRVLLAVAAMRIRGGDPDKNFQWPGGLPGPSAEEMEAAYRRLTQRLTENESDSDAPALNAERLDLLDRYRRADFATFAATFDAAAQVSSE